MQGRITSTDIGQLLHMELRGRFGRCCYCRLRTMSSVE